MRQSKDNAFGAAEMERAMENDIRTDTEGDSCPDIRYKKIPYGLAVMVAILALATLVLMLMLIASIQNATPGTGAEEGATSKNTIVRILENSIIVKWVTPYMTENQFKNDAPISSSGSEPEPTAASSSSEKSTSASAPRALDVDEDVAAALAKTAGFTPVSVYVFTKEAVDGGAESPRSGLVISTEDYTGRTNGEAFRFINVQTSEPISKARTVPDVRGMAWKSARAKLADSGLGIRFQYEYDSPDTFGEVIFQSPTPGTHMPRGSSVVVVLAN